MASSASHLPLSAPDPEHIYGFLRDRSGAAPYDSHPDSWSSPNAASLSLSSSTGHRQLPITTVPRQSLLVGVSGRGRGRGFRDVEEDEEDEDQNYPDDTASEYTMAGTASTGSTRAPSIWDCGSSYRPASSVGGDSSVRTSGPALTHHHEYHESTFVSSLLILHPSLPMSQNLIGS